MPKQILLVEDSVTMQKVVQIAFAREDYQITTATSTDEALARIKEMEGRPDVVVADAGLPGKSGYDLASAIRGEGATKDVPIILLTSNFSPYDEARGQKAGVDGHLVKPFDTQSVIDKVNNLLKGRAGAPATATSGPRPVTTTPVSTPAAAQQPAASRPTPAPVSAPPAATPAAVAAGAEARSTLMGMPQQAPPVGTPNLRPAPAAATAPAPTPARAPATPVTTPTIASAQAPSSEGTRMPEPIRASTSAGPGPSAPSSGMSSQVPQMPRPSLIPRAPVPATVLAALERIAARGAEFEAIARLSAETIQQVAWEVVPELAEVILRGEADKLGKERRA